MKRIELVFFIALLATSSGLSQTKPREVDLTIDGIGSGSPFSDVVAKFGVPPQKKIEKQEAGTSCAGRALTLLTLDYPGLQFVLLGDGFAQGFEVVEMTITSKKWNALGARIGDSPASIEKRFGKPVSTDSRGDDGTYEYVTRENLGGVKFEFTKGKLTKILMSETLC